MSEAECKMLRAKLELIEKRIADLKSELDELLKDAGKSLDNLDYGEYDKVFNQILALLDKLEKYIRKQKTLQPSSVQTPKPSPPNNEGRRKRQR